MKNKRFKNITILAILTVLVITLTAATTQKAPAGYLSYKNTKYNINMSYPKTWSFKDNINGTIVAFLTPRESKTDDFQDNVNIVMQDISSQPMDIDKYASLSIGQLKKVITDIKIISDKKSNLSGQKAHTVTFTGKQGVSTLKWIQVYMIKNKKAYVVTYTSKVDSFDLYIKDVNKMLGTVSIK